MFAIQCPRHDARVLLPASRIRAVTNVGTGIRVSWECWCGYRGVTLQGRNHARSRPTRPDAAA
jgi:hypothetical protein